MGNAKLENLEWSRSFYSNKEEDSVKNVGADFDAAPESTFIQKIVNFSLQAAGRKVSAIDFKDLSTEFSNGLAAHEVVCIYATKQFSVTILPDEDFNVAIQTENQSRLTVDAKYLEELAIVTKLQQAVQAELNAVKEWI